MFDEDEAKQYLQDLLDQGCISDGVVAGVTRQVIASGEDSLSDAQSAVFQSRVVKHYIEQECGRCGEQVPWSEMREAIESGYCGYCQHEAEKMERE